MSHRIRVFTLLLLFCSCLPLSALSLELSAAVARDLAPLSGVVVMPAGEEYLIDLDAAKGVREGDLFAVVQAGEKIVHPVTKEILGSLDQVKGYLQVTRVKSGYSYARPLDQTKGVGRGEQIRRFENMPALFWDYTGQGEGLYAELRAALPKLEWQSYAAAQSTRPDPPRAPGSEVAKLIFVLNDNGLGVKDGAMTLLRSYDPSLLGVAAAPAAAAPAATVARPSLTASAATVAKPGTTAPGIVAAEPVADAAASSGIVTVNGRSEAGVWYSPDTPAEPTGICSGDFDGDGRQEMAVAYPDRLVITRLIGTAFETLASLDLKARGKVLTLEGANLTGDDRPELYLTVIDGKTLASLVVEWQAGKYQVVLDKVPWYFRAVEFPGEGAVLLGQTMGSDQADFSGPVFRVERAGLELRKGAPVALPPFVSIYGFLPFVDEGGRTLIASLDIHSELQVEDLSGEQLWKSGDIFGGREAYIERIDSTVVRDLVTRSLYLKANLKRGPKGEILVPVNEGTRLLGNYRKFEKSQLKALVWDGRSLRELWYTRPQSGYLSDFTVADVDNDGVAEVAMTVLFSRGGFGSKDRSAVVVYELEQ